MVRALYVLVDPNAHDKFSRTLQIKLTKDGSVLLKEMVRRQCHAFLRRRQLTRRSRFKIPQLYAHHRNSSQSVLTLKGHDRSRCHRSGRNHWRWYNIGRLDGG